MRLEYSFELSQVDVPRFSVEAVEGIGKVFTLVTLVLNVLALRERVELVFHGLNPDDPARKLAAFQTIVDSASAEFDLIYEEGQGGAVPGSSSHYQWVTVRRV
jgi:hypothetical protein